MNALAQVATLQVLLEVLAERGRQHEKWGQQDHIDGTGSYGGLLTLRLAEAQQARAACKAANPDTWHLILREEVAEAFSETDPAALRAELVQVAAVAVQWIETIDRRQAKAKWQAPKATEAAAPDEGSGLAGASASSDVQPAEGTPALHDGGRGSPIEVARG